MLLLIRRFLASQDLTGDMIFEWPDFCRSSDRRNRKCTTKKTKKKQELKTRKIPKKPKATANFKFQSRVKKSWFYRFLLGCNPPNYVLVRSFGSRKETEVLTTDGNGKIKAS